MKNPRSLPTAFIFIWTKFKFKFKKKRNPPFPNPSQRLSLSLSPMATNPNSFMATPTKTPSDKSASASASSMSRKQSQSQHKSARFEAYNRLQAAAVAFGEKVPIPEIVALGGQSDGKSSLLEALLGFRFNVREVEMGTRRPLILQMVHDPSAPDPRCRFQVRLLSLFRFPFISLWLVGFQFQETCIKKLLLE